MVSCFYKCHKKQREAFYFEKRHLSQTLSRKFLNDGAFIKKNPQTLRRLCAPWCCRWKHKQWRKWLPLDSPSPRRVCLMEILAKAGKQVMEGVKNGVWLLTRQSVNEKKTTKNSACVVTRVICGQTRGREEILLFRRFFLRSSDGRSGMTCSWRSQGWPGDRRCRWPAAAKKGEESRRFKVFMLQKQQQQRHCGAFGLHNHYKRWTVKKPSNLLLWRQAMLYGVQY